MLLSVVIMVIACILSFVSFVWPLVLPRPLKAPPEPWLPPPCLPLDHVRRDIEKVFSLIAYKQSASPGLDNVSRTMSVVMVKDLR